MLPLYDRMLSITRRLDRLAACGEIAIVEYHLLGRGSGPPTHTVALGRVLRSVVSPTEEGGITVWFDEGSIIATYCPIFKTWEPQSANGRQMHVNVSSRDSHIRWLTGAEEMRGSRAYLMLTQWT
jgi:hypothetical protein